MAFKGIQIIYITTTGLLRMGKPFTPQLTGEVCLKCKLGPGGSLEPCEKHLADAQAILSWIEVESETIGGIIKYAS